jgi:uncharacterized protein
MSDLQLSLSDTELAELDAFLDQDSLQERSMDVAMLEGFAACLIVGPKAILPSQWLAWVWDRHHGEVPAEFESPERASRVMALVLRHYNNVAKVFADDPNAFVPVFRRGESWGVDEWCAGFLLGLQFCDEQWHALMQQQMAWFTPFVALGSEDKLDAEACAYVQEWTDSIVPTLVAMQTYWRTGVAPAAQDRRPAHRPATKVGRNDPCSCGSGLKYKTCCGGALH